MRDPAEDGGVQNQGGGVQNQGGGVQNPKGGVQNQRRRDVDWTKEPEESKVYPATHHFRVIGDETFDAQTLHEICKEYDLRAPVEAGNASSGGKYRSYQVSVHFPDRATHHRFHNAVKAAKGVKVVL